MILTIAALAIACQPSTPVSKTGEPQVRATVATIRTTIQPENKSYVHALMIANNLARSGDEVDSWRLFDLKKDEVTFVDDITRSYRTATIAALTKEHRDAYAKPADLARAEWSATTETRRVTGYETRKSVVRMGGYLRELWIAEKSPIPPQLFASMRASEPAPSPIPGVMRTVDEALLKVRGFPLADHAELPFGDKKMIVDRVVEKIEQKDVPASWFAVPTGYRGERPSRPQSPGVPPGD